MIRLFFALRPPEQVRDTLADLQNGVADARWQDNEQFHLTLRFVGEVARPVAEELADAAARLRCPAPTVRLAGAGAFGGRGRAGCGSARSRASRSWRCTASSTSSASAPGSRRRPAPSRRT